MKLLYEASGRRRHDSGWAFAVGFLLFCGSGPCPGQSAAEASATDPALLAWLNPQQWYRDSARPALPLGEKGKFDDQHIFAPHVIHQDGEFWMYYSGSQRCVDAGTY